MTKEAYISVLGSPTRGLLRDRALLVIAYRSTGFSRSLDEWSKSTVHELGVSCGGSGGIGLKTHLPSSSLFPPFPSSFLMPPCKMVINTKSAERVLAYHSSTVMCVLVIIASMYPQSLMSAPS